MVEEVSCRIIRTQWWWLMLLFVVRLKPLRYNFWDHIFFLLLLSAFILNYNTIVSRSLIWQAKYVLYCTKNLHEIHILQKILTTYNSYFIGQTNDPRTNTHISYKPKERKYVCIVLACEPTKVAMWQLIFSLF
jgi:hypothetical protein